MYFLIKLHLPSSLCLQGAAGGEFRSSPELVADCSLHREPGGRTAEDQGRAQPRQGEI